MNENQLINNQLKFETPLNAFQRLRIILKTNQ